MKQVAFTFDEHETVFIYAIKAVATVTKRCIKGDDETYLVVYWMDGQRREEWMHSWEIGGA